MNIYLISNSFKSFYLFRKEIISNLSKKHNVFLIANDDDYSKIFEKRYECIKLKNVFNNRGLLKNFFFILKLIFIFIKKKPDIVQTYTIHPNLVCIPIAKLFFAKTFAMITGMGATSVTENKALTKILDFFYKFSFYFCDHIIYVNEQNEKYFINHLRIKSKSTRIYGAGVDLKKKHNLNKFVSNKYSLKKTFNIIFVGRIIKEKGILDAIKIFKLLDIKNKKLIITGDLDYAAFSKTIDRKIFNYPGIIFTGHLKDTSQIFELANVFLLPSITEGMPTALMEAIKYDIPSISYKIPGVIDIIKDNINGNSVDIGSIQLMKNKIMKIYKLRQFRKNIIKNSKKLKFKIDRKNTINKVLSLYE
tara:strand:+ start:563 stop:1648 length:1086 start_codon:yes stop_codon:yes gene_type:complete